jgi:hypothetical protein
MALRKNSVTRAMNAAHAEGALSTHIARGLVYGTRRIPTKNAGTATPAASAGGTLGKGLRSVWDGPSQVKGGAPVLKRENDSTD